jgi:hypothetical protein
MVVPVVAVMRVSLVLLTQAVVVVMLHPAAAAS